MDEPFNTPGRLLENYVFPITPTTPSATFYLDERPTISLPSDGPVYQSAITQKTQDALHSGAANANSWWNSLFIETYNANQANGGMADYRNPWHGVPTQAIRPNHHATEAMHQR